MVEAQGPKVTPLADLGELNGEAVKSFLLESNMQSNRLTAVVTTFGATLLSVKHEVDGKM